MSPVYPLPQIHGGSRTRRSCPPVLPLRSLSRRTPLPRKTGPRSPARGAACAWGKTASASALVDIPAPRLHSTPVCIQGMGRGGRGGGRSVEQRAQPAAIPTALPLWRGRIHVPAHTTATPAPAPNFTASASTSGFGESPPPAWLAEPDVPASGVGAAHFRASVAARPADLMLHQTLWHCTVAIPTLAFVAPQHTAMVEERGRCHGVDRPKHRAVSHVHKHHPP
jgi:hypothetical protein